MLSISQKKEKTIFTVDSNHSFVVHVFGNKGDGRYWCGPILCILGSLVPSRKDNGCSRFQQICWPQPSFHNTMSLNSAVCTCMYVCVCLCGEWDRKLVCAFVFVRPNPHSSLSSCYAGSMLASTQE